MCTRCFKSFQYPNVLKAHLKFHCEAVRKHLDRPNGKFHCEAGRKDVERPDDMFHGETDRKDLDRPDGKFPCEAGRKNLDRPDGKFHCEADRRALDRTDGILRIPAISSDCTTRDYMSSNKHYPRPNPLKGLPPPMLDSYYRNCRAEYLVERTQASPDSTTPESPDSQSGSDGPLRGPPSMLGLGEASAFRPAGKTVHIPDAGSRLQLPKGMVHNEESGNSGSPPFSVISPLTLKQMQMQHLSGEPSGVPHHGPSGFMGHMVMPRHPVAKLPSMDGYPWRYLYPDQLGNMAAAAALARYQHAMSLMSANAAAAASAHVQANPLPVQPGMMPTLPYFMHKPSPSPQGSNHTESPQPDNIIRPFPTSQSPEISPSQLPYFPMPSDKEGEPLDLLPRSLYMTKSGRKGHLCIYCGKFYSRKYGLKIHLRTHTGYKPLKCKVCLRPFGDPSNLNKHIRLHAEGETPYRCNYCGKVLVRRRDLERHVKSRHPNEADKLLQEEETGRLLQRHRIQQNTDNPDDSSLASGSLAQTGTLLASGQTGTIFPDDKDALDEDMESSDSDLEEEEEEEIEVVELGENEKEPRLFTGVAPVPVGVGE